MNAYTPYPDTHLCAIGQCACRANGRPIHFHVSAHDTDGASIPERGFGDWYMYADVKTMDDARAHALAWFINDARVIYASVRESHHPIDGQPWIGGPSVEQIDRPARETRRPRDLDEPEHDSETYDFRPNDRAGDDEDKYETAVGPWVRDLRKIREDMDDHMSVIDDECAESEPDVSVIELETRSLLVEAQKMLDAVLALQNG